MRHKNKISASNAAPDSSDNSRRNSGRKRPTLKRTNSLTGKQLEALMLKDLARSG